MDCPKRNALAGLPDEAMLEILARTPFRSVCRSRCVAKAWRDLIDDPLNRRKLPQTLQGFFAISYPAYDVDSDDSSDRDGGHFFIKYLASPVPLDIDPCLSFLMKLPEIETLYFLDSCSGLLLFERCPKSDPHDVLSYIVCNPTTKHWATVPVRARCSPPIDNSITETYLIFDPAQAVSPHFHLIQFWKLGWDDEESSLTYEEIKMLELSVHTYSSESGVWSHSQTDWNEQGQLEGWRRQGRPKCGWHQRTFLNGILHLIVSGLDQYQIVSVDVQGKTKRIITTPDAADGRRELLWKCTPCIGQSQGRLYYINQDFAAHGSREVQSSKLSIWELQDHDTQEWVLKDTVSLRTLFGRMTDRWEFVVIHPDRNVLFFLDESLNKLIAYDMDRKEVSVVSMLSENLERDIVPYIPCFSESPALTNKN